VFGIELADTDQLGEEYITDMLLAGVYVEHDGAVVFGHLDSSFFDIDYLMPVPASDEVFSSGAAVATAAELQHAAVRNEMFRATMLEKQTDTDTSVHGMLVPVLVGAGIITE